MARNAILAAILVCLTTDSIPTRGLAAEGEKATDRGASEEIKQYERLRERSRWLHGRDGFQEEARELAVRALEQARTLFPKGDGRVAEDLAWLVQTQLDTDRYPEAEGTLRELIAWRQNEQPEMPWLIRDAENRLRYIARFQQLTPEERARIKNSAHQFDEAKRLSELGKTSEAIALASEGLRSRRAVLGYADAFYLEQAGLQIARLADAEEFAACDKLAQETLRESLALRGETHRAHAALLWSTAFQYRKRGAVEEAAALIAQASQVFATVLGEEDATTRQCLETGADVWKEMAEKRFATSDWTGAAEAHAEQATYAKRRFGEKGWRFREAQSQARFCKRLAALDPAAIGRLTDAMEQFEAAADAATEGRYAEGRELLERAETTFLALVGEGNDFLLQAAVLRAEIAMAQSGVAGADSDFQRATRLHAEVLGNDHPRTLALIDRCLEAGHGPLETAVRRGDYEAAERLALRAVSYQKLRDGPAHWRVRDRELDHAAIRRRAALSERERETVDRCQDRIKETNQLIRAGQWSQAVGALKECVTELNTILGPNDRRTAEAHHVLGFLLSETEDYRSAEAGLREALRAQTLVLGKDHPATANTWENLGVLLARIGDQERAEECFTEVIRIRRLALGPNDPSLAGSLTRLAAIHMARRDGPAAESLLREAVDILRASGPRWQNDLANTLNNLAGLYDGLGEELLAEQLYQEAGAIWERAGAKNHLAINLDNRAKFFRRRGDLDKARHMQENAVGIFRALHGDAHTDTAIALGNLAHVQLLQRDKGAFATIRAALAAWRGQIERSAGSQTEDQQLDALAQARGMLDLYLSQTVNRPDLDPEAWREVQSWQGSVFRRQEVIRAAREDPRLSALVAASLGVTRQLSALTMIEPLDPSRDRWREQVDRLRREKDDLERQLIQGYSGETAVAARRAPSTALESADVGANHAYIAYIAYRKLEARVPESPEDGEIAGVPNLAAFVVTGTGVRRVELGALAPIEDLVTQWRGLLRPGADGEEFLATGRQLRARIWDPLALGLPSSATILVAPDGPVARCSLAALPRASGEGFLIEDHSVVQVPVPRSAVARRPPGGTNPPTPPNLLRVGDVTFGDDAKGRNLPPLPGASREMEEIGALFTSHFTVAPSPPLAKGEATESALFARAREADILLFSTHGFTTKSRARDVYSAFGVPTRGLDFSTADDEPAENRFHPLARPWRHTSAQAVIALAGANILFPAIPEPLPTDDGLLTALEVAELPLERAPLVVLSACESGLGELATGEGILGLRRAFHLAGADAVVTSLWKVDDEATRVLMVEFFRNAWAAGGRAPRPVAEALRQAQLTVMRGYDSQTRGLRSPDRPGTPNAGHARTGVYYWGAFDCSMAYPETR